MTHPFGEDYLNYEKIALIDEIGLSDETKESFLSQLGDYVLLMEKISFEVVIEYPPLRAITDTCKSKIFYSDSCLKISSILLTSTDIVAKLVGHAIKTTVLKNNKNEKAYILAEKAHKKFRKQYECIGEINENVNGFEFADYDSYKILSNTQREKGSWAFFVKQTQYLYNKAIQNGRTDLKNPDECFK